MKIYGFVIAIVFDESDGESVVLTDALDVVKPLVVAPTVVESHAHSVNIRVGVEFPTSLGRETFVFVHILDS